MFYYAGIGSRETPREMLQFFEYLGELFAKKGFVLRSGHAKGADQAFEKGCDKVNGLKEIYLPWKWFENSQSTFHQISNEAMNIAAKYHPYWNNVSDGAKKLLARDVYQVLGYDLQTPSSFIVCWTKDGKGSGGTGQAIRIAKAYGIPVFDFGGYDGVEERLDEYIKRILNK